MSQSKQRDPIMCPRCRVAMNMHAEKLADPVDASAAKRVDPALGGMLDEFHTCPNCGAVAARPGG